VKTGENTSTAARATLSRSICLGTGAAFTRAMVEGVRL
jgi:hypothetical protein